MQSLVAIAIPANARNNLVLFKRSSYLIFKRVNNMYENGFEP